jgi:uncharacterized Tic20 family protein
MAGHYSITPEERTWAIIAHLSGLAGYIIPLGGAIVPIIIMFTKSESPVVSTLAKQALMLNIVIFLCAILCVILFVTIIFIPLAWLLSTAATLTAFCLPIIGAIKASEGYYFRYPLVGSAPN